MQLAFEFVHFLSESKHKKEIKLQKQLSTLFYLDINTRQFPLLENLVKNCISAVVDDCYF